MNRATSGIAAFALALLPATAWAHPGHSMGRLADGMSHPFTGADHLAAMLLAGFLARSLPGRIAWMVPVLFLAGLASGYVTGAWASAGLVEGTIAASLVVFTALALRRRLPVPPSLFASAIFGYAHGAAHGMVMPNNAAPALFLAGLLVSSVILHGTGYLLANFVWKRSRQPASIAIRKSV